MRPVVKGFIVCKWCPQMPKRKAAIVGHAADLIADAMQQLDNAELGQSALPHISLGLENLRAEQMVLETLATAELTRTQDRPSPAE